MQNALPNTAAVSVKDDAEGRWVETSSWTSWFVTAITFVGHSFSYVMQAMGSHSSVYTGRPIGPSLGVMPLQRQ